MWAYKLTLNLKIQLYDEEVRACVYFCGHMFNMKLRSRDINYSGCSTETGRKGANVDV